MREILHQYPVMSNFFYEIYRVKVPIISWADLNLRSNLAFDEPLLIFLGLMFFFPFVYRVAMVTTVK